MTFLSFSLIFDLLNVLHGVLNSNFKLCAFCCQWTHQGEIEKLSGQFLGLIMMSHWLGEVWIRIQDILVVWPLSLFIWRIVFACLVVCRWQVQHGWHGFLRFGLKTGGSGFSVWVSKLAATVWWFGSQNHREGFFFWASKLSRLWFIGCASKSTGGCVDAGYASRSNGLFRVEASRVRIFQFISN
jgi:hypothetical protein